MKALLIANLLLSLMVQSVMLMCGAILIAAALFYPPLKWVGMLYLFLGMWSRRS